MSTVFYIVLVVYLLVIMSISIWSYFRTDTEVDFLAAGRSIGPLVGGAVLAALTISLSVDRRFSFWFVIGALASLFILRLCAALLKRVARRMKIPRWAVLRFALTNLYRPGASTNSVVLSLGLGLAVLVAIALIEGRLD